VSGPDASRSIVGRLRLLALGGVAFACLVGPTIAHAAFDRIRHERLPPAMVASAAQSAASQREADALPSLAQAHHAHGSLDDYQFSPDLRTGRPSDLSYEDPFVPSVAPFKRGMVFDTVRADYTAAVASRHMLPVARGPRLESDDVFAATQRIEVFEGRLATLPSPAPGARVIKAELVDEKSGDPMPFRLLTDSAENWFLEATPQRARRFVRLTLQLAVARETFGFSFGKSAPAADAPRAAQLPASVLSAAQKVIEAVGARAPGAEGASEVSVRDNVARLVRYFRSFEESEAAPPGDDIYLALALSKKGVCRHRAFAFLVTALALKIPTRMALNEAHAWVEVHDGKLWKRIDLGGAGEAALSGTSALHHAPPDPFSWPSGATPASNMPSVRQALAAPSEAEPKPGQNRNPEDAPARLQAQSILDPRKEDMRVRAGAPARASLVKLELPADFSVSSGAPFVVRGRIMDRGVACEGVSVAVLLDEPKSGGRSVHLGTVLAGENGRFEATLVAPSDLPGGSYELVAATPGDARCGPGSSSDARASADGGDTR
jgi:Transglutaminase-like superfamily